MTVLLDSSAIIHLLEGAHPSSEVVAALLVKEKPLVSWINLGEVFYVVRRRVGEESAASALRDLRDVLTTETPSEARIIEAARIKSEYAMAYADAFAAATAVAHEATVWTGDPVLLLPNSPWKWRDLR